MKYAIVAGYYFVDPEGKLDYITKPMYLGLEGAHKIFVFDEEVNERTKLFSTAAEAGKYVDVHFNPNDMRCSFESVSIVEVREGN